MEAQFAIKFLTCRMKTARIVSILLSMVAFALAAQDPYDARQSVILQATVQESPAQIKLSWVLDTANGGYTIWRKSIHEESWGDSLINLSPKSTFWTDSTTKSGTAYEYQILKSLPAFPYGNGTPNFGSGYIYAGIKVPAQHHVGTCLVLLDRSMKQVLAFEIARLLVDLQHDGWSVDTFSVERNTPVVQVKMGILNWYKGNPDKRHALFILGRVPVPYSGDIATDGHHADHRGAWPCDGYYGTIDGLWTDQTVNNTTAASSRNDNVPGDGKFDNNVFPSKVELQIGRVDFSNMTKFAESEATLLKRYLDKNHAWRTGKMEMAERGLVDNNFPLDLEALGQVAWRNFSVMFGIANVKDVPYRQTLSKQSFLWSYGCGGGGPESASDISSTTNFTTDSLQSIFTMLFGSYFGDWDYPNNFLRAAIASKTCLISTWGNRPNWFLHHMALGEPIGYAAQLAMNNRGLYTPRFYGGYASTALMGDPTIKMHVLAPVEDLVATQEGLSVHLSWRVPKVATGFFVYRKYATDTAFQLLNNEPVTDSFFIDACVQNGNINYLVRSTALKTSGSGSYYNLSLGASAAVLYDTSVFSITAKVQNTTAGESSGSISITANGSCKPYSYLWENGQTTADLSNLPAGKYCVTVSDCNHCSQVHCTTVNVGTAVENLQEKAPFQVFPNPCSSKLFIKLEYPFEHKLLLHITNVNGRPIETKSLTGNDELLMWDIERLASGQYWIQLEGKSGKVSVPFTKSSK